MAPQNEAGGEKGFEAMLNISLLECGRIARRYARLLCSAEDLTRQGALKTGALSHVKCDLTHRCMDISMEGGAFGCAASASLEEGLSRMIDSYMRAQLAGQNRSR